MVFLWLPSLLLSIALSVLLTLVLNVALAPVILIGGIIFLACAMFMRMLIRI